MSDGVLRLSSPRPSFYRGSTTPAVQGAAQSTLDPAVAVLRRRPGKGRWPEVLAKPITIFDPRTGKFVGVQLRQRSPQ